MVVRGCSSTSFLVVDVNRSLVGRNLAAMFFIYIHIHQMKRRVAVLLSCRINACSFCFGTVLSRHNFDAMARDQVV